MVDYHEQEGSHTRGLLVSFYPGKFTSACVSAQECAEDLAARLGQALAKPKRGSVPMIAKQRYYDPSTYKLTMQDGMLEFETWSLDDRK